MKERRPLSKAKTRIPEQYRKPGTASVHEIRLACGFTGEPEFRLDTSRFLP